MSLMRPIKELLPRRAGRRSKEPGAALFEGLRIRLTLWYCAVLGVALVVFGVSLYLLAQYFLINPIQMDTKEHAIAHVGQWLGDSPIGACSSFGPHGPSGSPYPNQNYFMSEMVACFDQNGTLYQNGNAESLPAAFLSNTLAKTVLQTGQPADDTVDAGGTLGKIYRYALPVPSPTGSGYVGVVLVGEPIQTQENALSLLLILLLSVGGVTLLGAGGGGLFLANRALAPARLAWTNQQRFIADASHELRTPLTLMRADAEVLLRSRTQLDVEDAALLEDIVAETSHMSHLANNMLTLARLDNGAVHREHEVIDLVDLAQGAAHRVQALADQKGVTVQVERTATPYVIGDPILLEQAALVLLDNAIKYNRPGGRVTIRTSISNREASLEVSDTGIGIAAEHLPHLGERFYRVDKARSREAGGTGLGLSIAQHIANVHNGTLKLTSVPNEGTTVKLLFPLAASASSKSKSGEPEGMMQLHERGQSHSR